MRRRQKSSPQPVWLVWAYSMLCGREIIGVFATRGKARKAMCKAGEMESPKRKMQFEEPDYMQDRVGNRILCAKRMPVQ